MNLRQRAKGAPYHLAVKMEESPLWRFWVVLLDNGMEVYQTPENPDLKTPNSWLRLKQFCKDHNCKIVGMAFASQDLNPANQINLTIQADGYFYSKRIRKMLCANPGWSGYQDEAQGFGELHGKVLTIHWVDSKSGRVTKQQREIDANSKLGGTLGLIRN